MGARTTRQNSSEREETPSSTRDDGQTESPLSSPSSTTSPLTPDDSRPGSAGIPSTTDAASPDSEKEPESGPHRTRSASALSSKGSSSDLKEKRKRSRVTPEQLVHLERYFAMDRSPTAGRRKEISESLGMQERQTQIWFQNRRAKAKLQDGKNKGRGIMDLPPDSPPELSTGFDASLHNLIHENEPVTIIPCTELSIGTWKRIATTVSRHDLVAYVCEAKRCLTWFIQSSGYGFKMEMAFDTIVETKFTNAAPGTGLASFVFSRPPSFYLETMTSPPLDGGASLRTWKRCADWTEGMQASKVLRHDLVGSAVQLAHVLRNLNANASGSEISLHPPSYRQNTDGVSSPGLALPPINGYSQTNPDLVPSAATSDFYGGYERQRAYSSASVMLNPLRNIDGAGVGGAGTFGSQGYSQSTSLTQSAPGSAGLYSDFVAGDLDSKRQRYRPPHLELPPPEFHHMPISHTVARRMSYADEPPLSSGSSSFHSPSPPVHTPPYHSPGFWSNGNGMRSGSGPGALQRVSYDTPILSHPNDLR